MKQLLRKENLLYGIFAVSLTATLGSLMFSELWNLPPCVLCWYQRAMMYPIAVISTIAVVRRDFRVVFYTAALAAIGLAVSIYHNLLYWHILSESIAPCRAGISCTTKQIEWLGFITIPLMSLIAFTLIFILSIVMLKGRKYE